MTNQSLTSIVCSFLRSMGESLTGEHYIMTYIGESSDPVTITDYAGWRYNIHMKLTKSPKEKVQKDERRSTKHTYKTKDWVTWTPLKTGGELGCSGRVGSSCSTSDKHEHEQSTDDN
jgi:hypothetical protein